MKAEKKRTDPGEKVQGVLHGYYLWVFGKYRQLYGLSESKIFEDIVTAWCKTNKDELESLGLSLREFNRELGNGDVVQFRDSPRKTAPDTTP
jgi:hypothetical protein